MSEKRGCTAVGELDSLDLLGLKARWSRLVSVACIESTRDLGGKISTEQRYVISSLPADGRRILHAVRAHWGIENGLHWCLDVTFGEDASLIRLRNAAQNFSFLRRLGLNLFRADKSRAISLPRKLKTAAYNPAHLATALHLREIRCSSLVAPAGNDPSQAASVVCLQTRARCAPLAVFARALADGVLTARKNDDQTDCGLHGWHLE